MKVLVDTVVWSQAFRRSSPNPSITKRLSRLIEEYRAIIIGPIRQELLSGYSNPNQFQKLNSKLNYFPNEPILDEDYVRAAEFNNICRKKGIQGSHTDFLICSVAERIKAEIYTMDKDFTYYREHLPVKLFTTSNS